MTIPLIRLTRPSGPKLTKKDQNEGYVTDDTVRTLANIRWRRSRLTFSRSR